MSVSASEGRVLIADDQPDVLEALRLLLKGEGFGTESATSPAGILAALETREFDVVLMDLNYTRDTTSGQEGLDLLTRIQSIDAMVPVVVMTAWGTVDLAVEAMRRGARDFVQKPWDNARLMSIVRTQVELSGALRRGQRLEAENRLLRTEGRPTLIAESAAMQPVLQLISRGRSLRRERFNHRRAWHRQGSGRAYSACRFRARESPHGHGKRRWTRRGRFRKRTIRPRQRRVHRREDGSGRPI